MRTSKLQYSLALCLSLSLGGLTACDLELPNPEAPQEGAHQEDKVDKEADPNHDGEPASSAHEGSGKVELRLVDQSELSARAFPALDLTDIEAELTVKAIGVRHCLDARPDDPQADEPAQDENSQDESAEPEQEIAGRQDPNQAPAPSEAGEEEQVGDTVATDEELAEKDDDPNACRRAKWIILKQDELKIDLLNLSNMDAGGLLAEGELPVGTYRGIRLAIADAHIRVGEHEVSLKTPSGRSGGLKIRAGFEVHEDGQVEVDLGFDLASSLRKHPKHGWILRPVLRSKKRRD